jgi:hypothetical protein
LHQFVADGICYGMPDIDGPDDERDESGIPLRALPPRFSYLYDFGDGWEHEVGSAPGEKFLAASREKVLPSRGRRRR